MLGNGRKDRFIVRIPIGCPFCLIGEISHQRIALRGRRRFGLGRHNVDQAFNIDRLAVTGIGNNEVDLVVCSAIGIGHEIPVGHVYA